MQITPDMVEELQKPLPDWAVKAHPTRANMSAIHPMAIIDRLNSVFGFGTWSFTTEPISWNKEVQQTRNGERDVYVSAVKGTLEIPEFAVLIQQYGGSTNDDLGDSLKGSGTDALTKIASYLGIGAEIYKGRGNVAPGDEPQQSSLNIRR